MSEEDHPHEPAFGQGWNRDDARVEGVGGLVNLDSSVAVGGGEAGPQEIRGDKRLGGHEHGKAISVLAAVGSQIQVNFADGRDVAEVHLPEGMHSSWLWNMLLLVAL